MASRRVDACLRLVEHDREVLALHSKAALGPPLKDVRDWKVTLLFYMACVYVKAAGQCLGIELQDHFQIRQWLNSPGELIPMTKSYRKLEERSRDARYEGRCFTGGELDETVRWFGDVRDRVISVLRAKGVHPVPRVDPVDCF